ncbi:poly adp-ribose polymerase member 14-like protein [Stylonychia lemnae]|uniref:Poly [ADP-ribose] polymerase n=1 Tax=Stylonychia lemnae TaxID=5949 RepID=A0A078AAC2_STYLE|nr:poly adp-ribose polymerase member 14-like protein [Stylonychia lemnae]|eukprot:CDW79210.1 poly adp-ribose polymerase member 14-like protein [Stylonychia lemnae]
MDGIEDFIVEDIWQYMIQEKYEVKGADVFKQNFIDDFRDEVLKCHSEGKTPKDSVSLLQKKFDGLDLLIAWYDWHSQTDQGIQLIQKDESLKNKQNQQKEEEKLLKNSQHLAQQSDDDSSNEDSHDISEQNYDEIKKLKVEQIYAFDLQEIMGYDSNKKINGPNDEEEKQKSDHFQIYTEESQLLMEIFDMQNGFLLDVPILIQIIKTIQRQPVVDIEILGPRQWSYYINDKIEVVHQIDQEKHKQFLKNVDDIYDDCQKLKKSQSKWVQLQKKSQLFGCELNKFPFAVDYGNKNVYSYEFTQKKQIFNWHVFDTFKFPENPNDPKFQNINDFTCTEILDRDSLEFNEFQKMLVKHPFMDGLSLVKHLFHGTSHTDPVNIYSFEHGLDMRYSNDGANGIGLYFADNSNYSLQYAYLVDNRQRQMFMCTVITGLSSNQGGGRGARMPAPIPGKKGVLFDSFNNGNKGHFVIYDNQKSYPGYLITYK